MTTPVKPTFPFPVEFLASIGLVPGILAICCIKNVEIIAVTGSETVTIDYLGVEYPNIPVWMHTDYGTRRKVLQDSESLTAADYFERSALQFFLLTLTIYYLRRAGVWVEYGYPHGYSPSTVHIEASYPPTAIALVRNTGSSQVPLGIIGITQHGTQPYSGDNQYSINSAKGWPSYQPYTIIREKLVTTSTSYRYILWDMFNDCIAKVPNASFTAMIDADFATDITDYDYFIDQAIKLVGTDISYTETSFGVTPYGEWCVGGTSGPCVLPNGTSPYNGWVMDIGVPSSCEESYSPFHVEAHTCIEDSYYSMQRTGSGATLHVLREQILSASYFPMWPDVDADIITPYSGGKFDTPNKVRTYSTGYEYEFSIGFTLFDEYDNNSSTYSRVNTMIMRSSISGQKSIIFDGRDSAGNWLGQLLHWVEFDTVAKAIPTNLVCSYDLYYEQIITWLDLQTPAEPLKATFLIDLQFHENSLIQESEFPDYVETMHETSLAGVTETDFTSLEYTFDMLFIPYWLKASTL